MLNEDKVKLMTGIAMFEKREGKRLLSANRYFRSDYISNHLLLAFFSYTVCFGLCVLIWILYNSERLFGAGIPENLAKTLKTGGVIYIIGLILYLIVTGVVYARRYEYAKRGMKVYLTKLKRLEKYYEHQDYQRELTKEGVHYDGISRT